MHDAVRQPVDDAAFLSGGEEMGALMREHDWASTSLGPLEAWPQSLKVAVRLLLNSRHPMFIWWGPELIQFYNDAYRESLGPEKHPSALGSRGRDTWPEIWDLIGPQISQVMAGGQATWHEDQLVPILRHGSVQDVWWTYGYSPIDDEAAPNGVGGVLVICRETTAEVVTRREADERYRALFNAVDAGFCVVEVDLDGSRGGAKGQTDYRVVEANPAFYQQTGFPEGILGQWLRKAAPGLEEHWYETYERVARIGESTRFEQGSDHLGRWFDVYAFRLGALEESRVAILFNDVSVRRAADAALRQSEARLRGVLESMGEAFALLDRDFRILTFNKAALRLETRPLEEIVGRSHWEVYPGSEDSEIGRLYKRTMAEQQSVALDHRYTWEDGTTRWLEMRAYPVPEGLAVFWRDISERKEREAALRESERRFHALAENVSQLAWMAEPDGHIFWYNKRWYDYTGTDFEAMEGWGWREVHPPEQIDRVIAEVQANWARGEPWEGTYQLRGKDGMFRPFLTRAEPIRDANGALVQWFGTNTDISAQVTAETKLRELNETLEQRVDDALADRKLWADVFESSDALIAALAPNHRFLAMNKAYAEEFQRIYGIRPKVGDDLGELLASKPEHQAAALAIWNRALTAEDFNLTEEFGDPELDRPYYELRFNTLRDRKGHQIGAFQYAVDVSERLRAQADLAKAQDQLRQSQKMEAVGQLTGGLAHDFNNLLAGISGSLELMATRMTQGRLGDVERYLVAAQGAARRAAALTHRLLAFSRRQTLAPKVTDVNALVSGMEELIRRTVGPQVAVESVTGAGVWPVEIDPNQLENALLNLAINARDAMPDGGTITIETANRWMDQRAAREQELSPGQYVSLSVSDTGSGMAPEVVSRAFEPFFTTKPLGVGTGLGLSMVYGFARQSGGQVRIYSEVGQGTTVSLYLPRHVGGDEEPEALSGIETAVPIGAGETVLVIDDEPVVRMLVVDVLEELGYAALEASDGPEGLKVLQSKARVDLLITDVGLPGGLNGRQVADAARALRPELKILFITGYAENAVLNHGHLEHGMHVVTKPFAVEELGRKIKTILSVG